MIAQRQVWGETIVDVAAHDERVLVLDGDLATSTRADIIAERMPDRFIEIGIAEQNMVGVAVGLTTLGYRPWLSSFGVFLSQRALDQVRMLVSQTRAPVRLAASYAGLLNGSSGKTHQDIEDLAIMRAMPNMTVVAPADEHEARNAIRWIADRDGPVYLRLARDAVTPLFESDATFSPLPRLVRNGNSDTVVISTGVQTSRTRDALDILASENLDLALVHIPVLKPLDAVTLLAFVGDAKRVITVEEHSVIGGLGGLVAEIVTSTTPRRVERIGLADTWSQSGPNDFLLNFYGLSPRRVAETIRELLG